VQEIEQGNLDGEATRQILEAALHPMLQKNIDTVVLGCTHYPFVIPLIQQIVGEHVRVIDPAPSVAKQVRRVLETKALKRDSDAHGDVKFYTSGDPEEFKSLLALLLGEGGDVGQVAWQDDKKVTVTL
jgi:glutamate racemase